MDLVLLGHGLVMHKGLLLLAATVLNGCLMDPEPNFELVVRRTEHEPIANALTTIVELRTEGGSSVESLWTEEPVATVDSHLSEVEHLRACITIMIEDTADCQPAPFEWCVDNDNRLFVALIPEVCAPVVWDADDSFELTIDESSTSLEVTFGMYPKL